MDCGCDERHSVIERLLLVYGIKPILLFLVVYIKKSAPKSKN